MFIIRIPLLRVPSASRPPHKTRRIAVASNPLRTIKNAKVQAPKLANKQTNKTLMLKSTTWQDASACLCLPETVSAAVARSAAPLLGCLAGTALNPGGPKSRVWDGFSRLGSRGVGEGVSWGRRDRQ